MLLTAYLRSENGLGALLFYNLLVEPADRRRSLILVGKRRSRFILWTILDRGRLGKCTTSKLWAEGEFYEIFLNVKHLFTFIDSKIDPYAIMVNGMMLSYAVISPRRPHHHFQVLCVFARIYCVLHCFSAWAVYYFYPLHCIFSLRHY